VFLLVPAQPGRPGQRAVKRLCVCYQQSGNVQINDVSDVTITKIVRILIDLKKLMEQYFSD